MGVVVSDGVEGDGGAAAGEGFQVVAQLAHVGLGPAGLHLGADEFRHGLGDGDGWGGILGGGVGRGEGGEGPGRGGSLGEGPGDVGQCGGGGGEGPDRVGHAVGVRGRDPR